MVVNRNFRQSAQWLGAIIVIAIFYTAELSIAYLVGALAVCGLLIALNRSLRVIAVTPYLLGGH